MANKDQYKTGDFIIAIKGSGGIIAIIASRVGCQWHTAQKYIKKYPTVAQAYEDECERTADIAEGVVIKNIELAAREQDSKQKQVDSSDAKWWLSRKAKDRGYADKLQQEVTGADGGPLVSGPINIIVNAPDESIPD